MVTVDEEVEDLVEGGVFTGVLHHLSLELFLVEAHLSIGIHLHHDGCIVLEVGVHDGDSEDALGTEDGLDEGLDNIEFWC